MVAGVGVGDVHWTSSHSGLTREIMYRTQWEENDGLNYHLHRRVPLSGTASG